MKTGSFITASAEVTQITELKKGDVYKRLEESSYGDDKIIHGIVLDVLFNGQDAAIQAVEFQGNHKTLDTNFKVFSGGKELKIFPSSMAEVKTYLKDCVGSIERDIQSKEKDLDEAREKLNQANDLVSGNLIKKLTTPSHTRTPALVGATETEAELPADLNNIPF